MSKKKGKVRLTRRDYAILRDAKEYGMVVPEFLLAQRFPDRQLDAVKSTLRRLYGRAPNYLYLRPERLDAKRVYYRLTSRGCRLIGASRDASRPFGRKAVAQRYAILWFICVARPKKRRFVDPREFPQLFPGASGRLPRRRFFIEEANDKSMHIGLFSIDLRSDVRRLVRGSWQQLTRLVSQGLFRDYMIARRFVYRVLTYDVDKSQELEAVLRRSLRLRLAKPLRALGLNARVDEIIGLEVVVVPGMDTLIPFEERDRD